MLGVRSAAGRFPIPSFSTRQRRFSARAGSMQTTRTQRTRIQPELETRNGLSLARNDVFGAIRRSMLLPCSFASIPEIPANPFDRELLRSTRFSKPRPGGFNTLNPLPASFSDTLVMPSGLHSPLGISTLRIKAFNRLHHKKLALPDVQRSLAPRCGFFRLRFGSMVKNTFRPARLSFRKPWNWIDDGPGEHRESNEMVRKKACFLSYYLAYFSVAWRRAPVDSLCIKQRLPILLRRLLRRQRRMAEMHQCWWLSSPGLSGSGDLLSII
jgi:hypothetical protein